MAVVADCTMSEAPGATTAQDTGGGTQQNGTFQGGASTDGAGQLVLDGVDDFILVPASPEFNLAQGTVLIDATLDATPSSAPYTLISVDSTGFQSGGHMMIQVLGSGAVEVRHQTDDTSFFYAGGSVTPGVPFSVSYSFGPTGGVLMVDGVTVFTTSQAHTLAGGTELTTIGASQESASQGTADFMRDHWHGTIDRVVIDDAALAVPVCVAEETLIAMPDGERAAGDLRRGDLVLTRDHGALPLRYVSRSVVTKAAMAHNPKRRPIEIATGVLGNHRPLALTRQHSVLLCHAGNEVLVRAAFLGRAGIPGVSTAAPLATRTFVHVLLDQHALLWANGMQVETLLPGAPFVRRVLPKAPHPPQGMPPCRPILSAHEADALFASQSWSVPPTNGTLSTLASA